MASAGAGAPIGGHRAAAMSCYTGHEHAQRCLRRMRSRSCQGPGYRSAYRPAWHYFGTHFKSGAGAPLNRELYPLPASPDCAQSQTAAAALTAGAGRIVDTQSRRQLCPLFSVAPQGNYANRPRPRHMPQHARIPGLLPASCGLASAVGAPTIGAIC